MKKYNSIDELAEEQTKNFDCWSVNGEDFYDNCPYDCFNSAVDGITDDFESVRITGGKLEVLRWEQLVKPLDILESADCRYYDMVRDEDSVFDYFPRDFMKKWESELNLMILDKFKELDLNNAPKCINKTETFQVIIRKEDLE